MSTRRKAADITFAYKLLHGLVDIEPATVGVRLLSSNTRGSGVNLCVDKATSVRVGKCFNFRIAKIWNELPLAVKMASSTASF